MTERGTSSGGEPSAPIAHARGGTYCLYMHYVTTCRFESTEWKCYFQLSKYGVQAHLIVVVLGWTIDG